MPTSSFDGNNCSQIEEPLHIRVTKESMHYRLKMSEITQELVLEERGNPLIIGRHLDKQVRK